MTHVVNLLPWRDLRRRQRLRYVLLLTIGIVLLGGMGLLVSRTARLQRDFLATLHTTADAQLLASLKQREQAMREAWQQHQRQRQQSLPQIYPQSAGLLRLRFWHLQLVSCQRQRLHSSYRFW